MRGRAAAGVRCLTAGERPRRRPRGGSEPAIKMPPQKGKGTAGFAGGSAFPGPLPARREGAARPGAAVMGGRRLPPHEETGRESTEVGGGLSASLGAPPPTLEGHCGGPTIRPRGWVKG